MTRSRLLAAALAGAAGLGMLIPAGQATAQPQMAEPGCVVTDATLTWGFKESFRAYIDGDIANGEWTTSGAVTYETPEFTWAAGQGRYDPETGEGYVDFEGSVRFTGHDGLLDTTFSDPSLNLTDGGPVLILDVAGPSMEGEQIDAPRVEFVELPGLDVMGEGASVTLEGDTVLTADGEAAFPDYQAGTSFDPVTITLQLDMCSPPGGYSGVDDISPPPGPPAWVVAGAILGPLLLIAAIIGAVLLATRRRRAGA
jgi:hypothetical protein